MREVKVLKVVKLQDGRLVSSMAANMAGIVVAEYKIGQFTSPPVAGSKLFVYEERRREMLEMNVRDSSFFFLFCATAINPLFPVANILMYPFLGRSSISNYWLRIRTNCYQDVPMTIASPPGTLWCDQVRLDREIIISGKQSLKEIGYVQ